jgi:hypothetical protein
MKFKEYLSKFLTNKWVLNIIVLLSFFNVIGYAVMGNINVVLYFVVLAFLVRYFSKNMIIVLGIPLIFINLLAIKNNISEGMQNNTTTKKSETSANNNEQKKINELVENNKNKPNQKTSQGLIMQPLENNNNVEDNAAQTQQGFQSAGRGKNYEIDYASTIEDAYDQLNSILGSEGIQRLTSDTQNLMKQQMQLAEAMKGMTPVIKSIAPMVENLKGMMGDGKEGLGSILDMAKKFSSQMPSKQ